MVHGGRVESSSISLRPAGGLRPERSDVRRVMRMQTAVNDRLLQAPVRTRGFYSFRNFIKKNKTKKKRNISERQTRELRDRSVSHFQPLVVCHLLTFPFSRIGLFPSFIRRHSGSTSVPPSRTRREMKDRTVRRWKGAYLPGILVHRLSSSMSVPFLSLLTSRRTRFTSLTPFPRFPRHDGTNGVRNGVERDERDKEGEPSTRRPREGNR